MTLSPAVEEKLRIWLASPTWHMTSRGGLARWFDFVDAYLRAHGYVLDRDDLQQQIEANAAGCQVLTLENAISDRITIACVMLTPVWHGAHAARELRRRLDTAIIEAGQC